MSNICRVRNTCVTEIVSDHMGASDPPGVNAGSGNHFREGSAGRLTAIGGKTRIFCVLGHPVGHSMSPAMHNAALAEMGIDGVYVAFDVAPEGLRDAIHGLQALGVVGVNCTIPHKQALLPLMDEVSEDALLIGAVNTVRFAGGKRIGENTDAPGFLADLRSAGVEPAGKQVLVLGAGGSARAVVVALVRTGARVVVANRTVARAEELAEELSSKFGAGAVEGHELRSDLLEEVTANSEIIVNTTSLGMSPRTNEMPDLPMQALRPEAFVYDLIYNPEETRLLREARERGVRGMHGAGMLARQGALALEMWVGRPAPANLMEQVILNTLRLHSMSVAGTKAQQ